MKDFETFRATRSELTDISEVYGDPGENHIGHLYEGGDDYGHVFVEALPDGRYWTIMERDDIVGSLEECERHLFLYLWVKKPIKPLAIPPIFKV